MHLRSCAARLRQRALLAVLTALVPVGALHAGAVIYVDDDASPNGNGESWDTAYRFLSDALGAAAESDAGVNQIRIAQGLYLPDRSEATPGGSGNRSASFELIDGLELRGGYAGIGAADPDERDITLYESVLSGDLLQDNDDPDTWNLFLDDNSYHVVKAIETTPASKLAGLTVTWGYADGQEDVRGGGVALIDSALNVVDCKFMFNRAYCEDQIVARGGAIWSTSSTLNVTRTLFKGNRVRSSNAVHNAPPPGGGAIAASASSVTLTGCEFSENKNYGYWSSKGGALWAATGTEVTMTDCSFHDNLAYTRAGAAYAGAVFLSSATANASDCTFDHNRLDTSCDLDYFPNVKGGAWFLWNSTASFERCEFIDNLASAWGNGCGGALMCEESNLLLSNCVVAGNALIPDEEATGGALYLWNTSATLINTLVAHNYAYWTSAIYHSGSGMITIVNSMLWGNEAWGEVEETQIDAGQSHVDINYSCVEGWTGDFEGAGNHGLDPHFADRYGPDGLKWTAHDNNFRLISGSPCVDAGDNSATDSEIDLDGNDRFVDDPDTVDTGIGTPPIIDMGPYEGPFEVPPDLCPMDLDDNGAVDFQDLLVLLGAWNNPYSFVDLVELLATWGDCP